MQRLTVTAFDIRPAQDYVRERDLKKYLEEIRAQGYYPLPAIKINGDYVIGDGHHRGSGLFLLSEPIELQLLETDEEIRDCKHGMFCKHKNLIQAKRFFIKRLDELSISGIMRIWDIGVVTDEGNVRKLGDISIRDLSYAA